MNIDNLDNIDSFRLESCFHLLQKVLSDAFQVQTLLNSFPHLEFVQTEPDIQHFIETSFFNSDTEVFPSPEHPERRFFVIQNNIGIVNIIIYLNFEKSTDYFSIGPFRSADFSDDAFFQLLKEWNLHLDAGILIQKYYERLPYAPILPVVNIAKEIVVAYYHDFEKFSPIYVEFSKKLENPQPDLQLLQDLSIEYAEKYQKSLSQFCEYVAKGEAELAFEAFKEFLNNSNFFHAQKLSECKKDLYLLNDYCQAVVLGTIVHPVYTLKLYDSIRIKIDNTNSRAALLSLPDNICHKYCLLVKNHALPEYSQTVRDVINYIHLHIDEDLTLSSLARKFEKNASTLSSTFSKEVGSSITNYIHKTRVYEALRYFNSTKLSISEVALMVGFQDFAYFSRVFHKHIGCSPRDYCKRINR